MGDPEAGYGAFRMRTPQSRVFLTLWEDTLYNALLPIYESVDALRSMFEDATAALARMPGFPDREGIWPMVLRALAEKTDQESGAG